jgi:succinate dehydrogenase / fumarate reductase, flavoprotein subunit
VPGLFAPASARRACTARTASAATRCRTSSSSAARAGHGAPSTPRRVEPRGPSTDAQAKDGSRRPLEPFDREGGENPYTIQKELQDVMQKLVGIIRNEDELREALVEIERLKERAKRLSVEGHRQYNPGWHLALDLKNMLIVSRGIAKAALERKESRGGHTRDDFPETRPGVGSKSTW